MVAVMPGRSFSLGVVDVDDGRVRDDARDVVRAVADLRDLAVEDLARERVDDAVGVHPVGDLADVGFVDVGQDPHLAQVLGDDEEHRRLEARDHGGARVDAARHDDAVDRASRSSCSRGSRVDWLSCAVCAAIAASLAVDVRASRRRTAP